MIVLLFCINRMLIEVKLFVCLVFHLIEFVLLISDLEILTCFVDILFMFLFLLFAVKLPELLAYVKIDEETLIRLRQRLLEFIKYVVSPIV